VAAKLLSFICQEQSAETSLLAIKHFVANDQEDERTAAESVMTDRALREVYLYPYVRLLPDDVGMTRSLAFFFSQVHVGGEAREALGLHDLVSGFCLVPPSRSISQ